jgi:hypothetical protein
LALQLFLQVHLLIPDPIIPRSMEEIAGDRQEEVAGDYEMEGQES